MISFVENDFPSLGVEEEFHLIDPHSAKLAHKSAQLMASLDDELRERTCHELFYCIIENRSGIFKSIDDLEQCVITGRQGLSEACKALGILLVAGGTHPFDDWRRLKVVRSEHYDWVKDNYAAVVQRMLGLGLHVHVGVKSGDAALYVMHEMKRWTYPLLALSCNSPYFDGQDYGLLSARTSVFHALPRTRFAPSFGTFAELESCYHSLLKSGDVKQYTNLWWIIRPHPKFGTLEYRIFDMCTDVKRISAIAAVVQAATDFYQEEFLAGKPRSVFNECYLEQNEWRASRDGLEAVFVDPETGERVSCRGQLDRLLNLIKSRVEALGSQKYVDYIHTMMKTGTEADYQRKFVAQNGDDLRALELDVARRTCLF